MNITHAKQVDAMSLDQTITRIAKETLHLLDEAYGEDRDLEKDVARFVTILATENDLDGLKAYKLDVRVAEPEYVDYIIGEEEDWLVAMFLVNCDYSITLIMPLYQAPIELLKESEMLLDSVEVYQV